MQPSKFFPELSLLLFEPDFLEYLENVHSEYIEITDPIRWSNMDTLGETYFLTLEQWKIKAQKSNGLKNFLSQQIIKSIQIRWKIFESEFYKDNRNSLTEFKAELYHLKSLLQTTDYLKPISKEISDQLNRIAAHYNATIPGEYYNEEKSESTVFRPLKWNGEINVLVTLFYDLRKKKLASNNGVYLDADDKQLSEFIARNFIDKNDKPLELNTIRTILQPTKPEKRAKEKKKINVDDHFSS